MSQHYSDPKRANDAYSLPDVETFYMGAEDFLTAHSDTWMADAMRGCWPESASHMADDENDERRYDETRHERAHELAGWYWWACFPGCLPDGDGEPSGPFATEDDALEDAREGFDDDDENEEVEP